MLPYKGHFKGCNKHLLFNGSKKKHCMLIVFCELSIGISQNVYTDTFKLKIRKLKSDKFKMVVSLKTYLLVRISKAE